MQSGVYTGFDYADIIDHLNKRWDIAGRSFKSPEARRFISAFQR